MGLPENLGVAMNGVYLQCRGNNPKGSFYAQNFPNADSLQGMIDEWTRYVRDVGPGAIIYFDENHQSNWPKSYQFENWKIIGLRLDGSVIVRTDWGFLDTTDGGTIGEITCETIDSRADPSRFIAR